MVIMKKIKTCQPLRKGIKWICFLSWLFLIFYFSHQPGTQSTELSDSVVHIFDSVFHNSWISKSLLDVTLLVRKSAHFGEYFILGIFTVWLFREYISSWKHIFLFAFLFCVCYAMSDEFHQLFILGRSGKLFDVFIDGSGAFFGIIFTTIWHFGFQKNS